MYRRVSVPCFFCTPPLFPPPPLADLALKAQHQQEIQGYKDEIETLKAALSMNSASTARRVSTGGLEKKSSLGSGSATQVEIIHQSSKEKRWQCSRITLDRSMA